MTPTTDLQKPFSDWRLKTWAEMGPWQCIAGANSHVFDGTIVDSSYSGIAFVHATRWDDPELGVTPSPSAELIAMAPDLAARLLELEAENARLRGAILDIKQNWDWWDEDRYDRCSSVVGDAIADAMKEPTL
jgi:hypothetical protein